MRIVIELERPRPRQWRRRRLAAVVIALALAIPTGALAAHNFTDVPASHTFHADIADAYGARLTAGCSPTTFCPDAAVTRGQMTAFLNRGLGRAGQGSFTELLTSGTFTPAATVTIRAGNVTGGTALVLLSASANAFATAAGCPCEVRLDLRDALDSPVTDFIVVDMPAITSGDDDTDVAMSLQGMVAVPTGVDHTFTLYASRPRGSAAVTIYGKLHAIYVPFDAVGNVAGFAAPADAGDHPRR